MSVDFQQVRQDVQKMGEEAKQRDEGLKKLRQTARSLLDQYAHEADFLNARVQQIVRLHDPNLRCALPARTDPEALNAKLPLPLLPVQATLLAVDGSQIPPSRHEAVHYALVNVGAIQTGLRQPAPPQLTVHSHLIYGDELYTGSGTMSEEQLSLLRDLEERKYLIALARQAPGPVLTFTDGPIELWGAKDSNDGSGFSKSLEEYQQVLRELCRLHVTTAGYVDKPAANLLVRLLEVAMLPEDALKDVRHSYPLQGVMDRDLLGLLDPGERSAVFGMQSRSAQKYRDELALHFFYLNVGRDGHPWPVRVEIPAWVAENPVMLDMLHAVLVDQCRVMGTRPYPYLLHRAHETAVVSMEERQQVTQMIIHELLRRKVEFGDKSNKQSAKESGPRTPYRR